MSVAQKKPIIGDTPIAPNFGEYLLPKIREIMGEPTLTMATVRRFATAAWGSGLRTQHAERCRLIWRAWMVAKGTGHLLYQPHY